MPQIIPTIGQIVLVYRPTSESSQWEPARIVFVHDNRRVNVAGFGFDGRPFFLAELELDGDYIPEDPVEHYLTSGDRPFACWMPYQLKQAGGFGQR